MRTEQLVNMLARQSGPAPRWAVQARLGPAIALGIGASAVAVVTLLGANPGLLGLGSALVIKMVYVTSLLLAASWLADRLARPGAPVRRALQNIAAIALVMGVVALLAVVRAPDTSRLDLLLGRSWASCPWRVAALSVPALVAALWAMRGLAPTRPRLAGFAAGLMAGSAGALGYSLYCPEVSPLFVLTWYSIGILMPACVGALLGPRLLRW